MKKNRLPIIYDYSDVRLYLKEYQIARQNIDTKFTKHYLCIKIGLPNTNSYFTEVLKGKIISDVFVDRFISALELHDDQASYFRLLVKYTQADDEIKRRYLYRHMIKLKSESIDKASVEVNKKELTFSDDINIFNPIIAYIIKNNKVKNYDEIVALLGKLNINKSYLEKSYNSMKRLNSIKTQKNGYLKVDKYEMYTTMHKPSINNYILKYCIKNSIKELKQDTPLNSPKSNFIKFLSDTQRQKVESLLINFKNDLELLINNDQKNTDRKLYTFFCQQMSLFKNMYHT